MAKVVFVPFTIKKSSYDIVSRIIQSLVEFSTHDIDFILFADRDIRVGRKIFLLRVVPNNMTVWWQMWLTFLSNIKKIDRYFYVIDDPKTLFFWLTAKIFRPDIKFIARVGGSYEVRFRLVEKKSPWDDVYTQYIQKLVIRLNLKIASKIIFVSQYCRADFQKYFTIPKHKCFVIYNGVSIMKPKVFSLKLKNRNQFKGVAIFNGRFVKQKRAEIIFELSRRLKNVLFVIITTGLKENSVPRRHNIQYFNQIVFNQVIELYHLSDLYLAPSLMEGCSNALLEAMASGLPVIASRSGTLPELVEDKQNGYIIDVNADELKHFLEKIELIINEPGLKEKFAKASLAKTQTLSWQIVTKKYEAVFMT